MINWKTTLGGALSALGTTLAGVGTVSALSGLSPKLMVYIALAGFFLSALGKFFGFLFAQDAVQTKVNASIVQLLIGTLLIGSLIAFTLTGCKTASNPTGVVSVAGVQSNPALTSQAVQAAAELGAITIIQKNPDTRQYFLDASIAIGTAIALGNDSPASVQACLQNVTTNILVVAAITSALDMYSTYYSQVVTNNLGNSSPYTVPVLAGLATGIHQAYNLTVPSTK